MKVVRVEDGLAVRLPEEVVGLLGLKEGDEVEIEAAGGRTLRVGVDPARQAALDRLKALSRPFPPDYRFDRDEANERGGRDWKVRFSSTAMSCSIRWQRTTRDRPSRIGCSPPAGSSASSR